MWIKAQHGLDLGSQRIKTLPHKDAEYRRVEVITGQKRRRDWTPEEKAEILSATMAPGATVTEVARRFGVNPALVWKWRRKTIDELAAQTSPRFVPLRIESEVAKNTAVVPETAPAPRRWHRAGIKPRDRLRLRSGEHGSGWKALSIWRFCARCCT